MKKNVQFIVIFLSLLIAASGFCQIQPGAFSISPFVGGYTFEGNQDLRTAPVIGLRGGYDFTKHFGAELLYDYLATKYTGGANDINTNVHNIRLEGLYHFMPEQRLVPFIAAGIGGQRIDYNSGPNSEPKFTAAFGAGLKYFITDWVALRADLRDVHVFDISRNNLEYTVGLSFLFGGEKKAAQSSTQEPEAAPVVSSVKEPPSAVTEVEKKEEKVAVADVKEQEQEQKKEAAAPVTIVKQEEQKETAKEAAAVAAVAKEMVEKGRATVHVRFDFDKADIKPEFYKEIEKFAKVMEQHKELKVVIEGHTDNIGEKDYNQGLSERRANSVRTCLIEKFGIEASRLTSKGYGMSKPIFTNKSKAGRQKNRRVEAVVDYTITK